MLFNCFKYGIKCLIVCILNLTVEKDMFGVGFSRWVGEVGDNCQVLHAGLSLQNQSIVSRAIRHSSRLQLSSVQSVVSKMTSRLRARVSATPATITS